MVVYPVMCFIKICHCLCLNVHSLWRWIKILSAEKHGKTKYLPHEQTTTGRERNPKPEKKKKTVRWLATSPPAGGSRCDRWGPQLAAGCHCSPGNCVASFSSGNVNDIPSFNNSLWLNQIDESMSCKNFLIVWDYSDLWSINLFHSRYGM